MLVMKQHSPLSIDKNLVPVTSYSYVTTYITQIIVIIAKGKYVCVCVCVAIDKNTYTMQPGPLSSLLRKPDT